ncbi:porin family protein [Flavobacterium psychraquaticum]|uniref:porin family protein n=1 Tax=Flavobacterium psychraquaticum TaxID=3103958 RepID=UPI002ACEE114|nr:porin family protein [Flavobacterium sp. LB-N7T]
MKKFLFAVILLVAFGSASAQEKTSNVANIKFGAKGGINFANLAGDDADGAKMFVGFNAGFFIEIPVADKLVFQPEILYSAQGSKSEGPLFVDGSVYNVEATFKFNYINIPLLFKYEIADKFSLEAGPYVGFLTSAKLKANIQGVGSETIDAKDMLKSTDFGIAIGMNYEFTDVIFANARYQSGLTEIGDAEGNNNDIKNSVFQIGLGFRF